MFLVIHAFTTAQDIPSGVIRNEVYQVDSIIINVNESSNKINIRINKSITYDGTQYSIELKHENKIVTLSEKELPNLINALNYLLSVRPSEGSLKNMDVSNRYVVGNFSIGYENFRRGFFNVIVWTITFGNNKYSIKDINQTISSFQNVMDKLNELKVGKY